jgi:hypothetical protein
MIENYPMHCAHLALGYGKHCERPADTAMSVNIVNNVNVPSIAALNRGQTLE